MGNNISPVLKAASEDDISALCVEVQQHPTLINDKDEQVIALY
jgi:hypothetical protein